MSVPGRREWNKLAPILDRMGVLTEADADSLAELCEAKAILKASWSTELWRAIQAASARFGLSPSDRARLSVNPQKPKNKLERFLGGG
jgi:phage terminase small subunit